jgi:hypothetical protein
MTLPANIRINTSVPFPALVFGTGPITVTKTNGIWTLGYSILAFGTQIPPSINYPTDYLLGYDSTSNAYFKISISSLISAVNPGAVRAQRYTTVTPIVVSSSDSIITSKITTPAACTLPTAASRGGAPLTFKDLGQAGANNITFTPSGGDTIDGLPNFVLKVNYGSVTFVPFNDGTNTGWMVQ